MSARDARALAELEAAGAADALEALEALTGYAETRADAGDMRAPSSHAAQGRRVLREVYAGRYAGPQRRRVSSSVGAVGRGCQTARRMAAGSSPTAILTGVGH